MPPLRPAGRRRSDRITRTIAHVTHRAGRGRLCFRYSRRRPDDSSVRSRRHEGFSAAGLSNRVSELALAYTLAHVTDRIDGRDVPREWDQRHAVTASADWTRHGWNVNVAATYHSACPTTPVEAAVVDGKLQSSPGPLRSSRLTAYRRFDMRLSRTISKWELFVELFNIFGRSNTIRIDDFNYTRDSTGSVVAVPDTVAGLKFVPSFGVTRHW